MTLLRQGFAGLSPNKSAERNLSCEAPARSLFRQGFAGLSPGKNPKPDLSCEAPAGSEAG
jgi:hypothetical protein